MAWTCNCGSVGDDWSAIKCMCTRGKQMTMQASWPPASLLTDQKPSQPTQTSLLVDLREPRDSDGDCAASYHGGIGAFSLKNTYNSSSSTSSSRCGCCIGNSNNNNNNKLSWYNMTLILPAKHFKLWKVTLEREIKKTEIVSYDYTTN